MNFENICHFSINIDFRAFANSLELLEMFDSQGNNPTQQPQESWSGIIINNIIVDTTSSLTV